MNRPASGSFLGQDLVIDTLDLSEFRRIAKALLVDAGITLPESKITLVHSRLSKRLRALKIHRFADYCDFIEGPDGAAERRHLLTALTTNVTKFFREPHHFEALKSELLPPLLQRAKQGGRVRIWSAGCSSGEEPYSIAMTVLSLAPDIAHLDFKILASDIDPEILQRARRGVYSDLQVKGLSSEQRARFLRRRGQGIDSDAYEVVEPLKLPIAFRELNLTQKWPFKGTFDIIFCRNVVIYFNEETAQKVWSQFASALTPGGHLLIGHSERVSGPAIHQFTTAGFTTYQRK